jgi:transposase
MRENNHLDFTGQKFFAGIDVHKKSWTVTVRHNDMELKTFSMNPSPEELRSYMDRRYPGASCYSVYEAGYCGFWIHRALREMGFNNIVIHPADVPTSHKEKTIKTDKVDSRKLARELEKSNLRGIYIPDEFHQQLRSLSRLRFHQVQDCTRVKSRIKGHLYTYGVPMPSHRDLTHWSGGFISWLESIEFSYAPAKDYLRLCIEELQQHREHLLETTRLLREYCKVDPIAEKIRYLRSVPGIGFVVAVTFYSEIVDINRFPTLDHLASYVGLVPYMNSSGERDSDGEITNRRNRYLRSLITEAAWVAVRNDPALLLAFSKLTLRMKKQDAIIRIARKLLSRVRYVWKNQKPYVTATT